jgi:hypothetical protein
VPRGHPDPLASSVNPTGPGERPAKLGPLRANRGVASLLKGKVYLLKRFYRPGIAGAARMAMQAEWNPAQSRPAAPPALLQRLLQAIEDRRRRSRRFPKLGGTRPGSLGRHGQRDLRARIRIRLVLGLLKPLNGGQAWASPANGRNCTLCAEAMDPPGLEYALRGHDAFLHAICFSLWFEESLRLARP